MQQKTIDSMNHMENGLFLFTFPTFLCLVSDLTQGKRFRTTNLIWLIMKKIPCDFKTKAGILESRHSGDKKTTEFWFEYYNNDHIFKKRFELIKREEKIEYSHCILDIHMLEF